MQVYVTAKFTSSVAPHSWRFTTVLATSYLTVNTNEMEPKFSRFQF